MLLCARLPGVSVSKPTNRLRSPASAARSTSVAAQDGIDGGRALKQTSHAAHAVEERRCESAVAKQVIVEKVQVAPRQSVDLGERVVHALRVERSPTVEEGVLVAEVAMLRAAARDDD